LAVNENFMLHGNTQFIEEFVRDVIIQQSISFYSVLQAPSSFPVNGAECLLVINIITYSEDTIDKISDLLQNHFNLQVHESGDGLNSSFKSFSFRKTCYLATLKQTSNNVAYTEARAVPFLVKISSIFHRALVAMECALGKRGDNLSPAIQKGFYNIGSLLERAEQQFQDLYSRLNEGNESFEFMRQIQPNDALASNKLITPETLKNFVSTSTLLKDADKQIADRTNAKMSAKIDIDGDVQRLNFLQITSLPQLEEALQQHKNDIIAFAEKWIGKDNNGSFDCGISLFYLEYLLVGKKNDLLLQ
jgi:hypothetical protein